MSTTVDVAIQEAQALLAAINTHAAELAERGYDGTRVAAFQSALETALKRDSGQKGALAMLNQRTEAQDIAMKRASVLLAMVRNAAKSAFGKEKKILKEFRVGMERPATVRQMLTVMEYMTGVVQKYSSELLQNGMSQENIDSVATAYAELVTADALQENAKKLRNGATGTREEALGALQKEIYRLRKFAQVRFANEPAIQQEFRRLPKAGGRRAAAQPAKASPASAAAGA
jgi:hypothetical protein